MRDIRPIRSDADLAWALAEVDPYFANEPEIGSEESDRFAVLCDLIEAYESKTIPTKPSEPIIFLKNFLDMTGRTQADLGKLFGSRSRASEVLLRKRALTVEMIGLLNREWGVPADLLVQPYALAA